MRDPVWNVSGGGSGRWLAEEAGPDSQIMDDLPAKVYLLSSMHGIDGHQRHCSPDHFSYAINFVAAPALFTS